MGIFGVVIIHYLFKNMFSKQWYVTIVSQEEFRMPYSTDLLTVFTAPRTLASGRIWSHKQMAKAFFQLPHTVRVVLYTILSGSFFCL